ncbi:MAG: hypothetical protein ACXVDN_20445 [Ktedonobacteraceae bacterium]
MAAFIVPQTRLPRPYYIRACKGDALYSRDVPLRPSWGWDVAYPGGLTTHITFAPMEHSPVMLSRNEASHALGNEILR